MRSKRLYWAEAVLAAALLLLLTASAVSCWRVIHSPAPLEYREDAIILSTDLMLHGDSPYSLESQPVYINCYGLAYNSAVACVMRLTGSTDPFFVHRLMSIATMVACCLALFMTLRRDGVGWLLGLTGSITWLFHLSIGLTATARPDGLGLLLFFASMIVPWNSRFSKWGVMASVLFGILAFLTKPYFVLGTAIMLVYVFLFVNKRNAIMGGLAFVVLFSGTLVVMNHFLPCYLFNLFPVAGSSANRSYTHFAEQSSRFLLRNLGMVLAGGFTAITGIVTAIRTGLPFKIGSSALFNWTGAGGLLNLPVRFVTFAVLCVVVVLVLLLGPHTGQTRLYYEQLLAPFLYWWMLGHIQRLQSGKAGALIVLAISAALVPFSFNIPKVWQSSIDLEGWTKVEAEIKQHSNVLAGPLCAHILMQERRPVYSTGQTEFFKSALDKGLLSGAYREQCQHFLSELSNKVQKREFDLIIRHKGDVEFVAPELIAQNYEHKGSCRVDVSLTGPLDVEFWVRRP